MTRDDRDDCYGLECLNKQIKWMIENKVYSIF